MRTDQEEYIEAAADALVQTGTGCVTTDDGGITFIDYFHGTREQAVAIIKESLKRK